MDKESRILILGAGGLVGKHIAERLKNYSRVYKPESSKLDLEHEDEVNRYFEKIKPEYVFFSAAFKAGVEEYSKYPVQFLSRNLKMELNVINACYVYHVTRMVYVGASCIYPESRNLRIDESYFASGWVQKATEPYALAKAVGTRLCEYYNKQFETDFVVASLSNIYGWCDEKHNDLTSVIPSMIRKFQEAVMNNLDEVVIWGTGKNEREFLYVKDCADALVQIMESDITGIVNVGSGEMVTINELAELIAGITGFQGTIAHDLTKPEGSGRSVLDTGRLQDLDWIPHYSLEEGLREMIKEKMENGNNKNSV